MADEEVDWGMDEQEDEWRGDGLNDSERVDDDVISLEGGDDDAQATSARQPASGLVSKNPPTGPKKGRKGEAIGDHRQGEDSQTSRINVLSVAVDSDKPSDGEASPLPPGWTAVMSKSHNRYFYFHKETNQTVWEKPAFPVEPVPEAKAQPMGLGVETEVDTVVSVVPGSDRKATTERPVPTGPSASRPNAAQSKSTHAPAPTLINQETTNQNVANAYARRQTQPPASQGGGSGAGPGGRNSRARSPLRGDRDGDVKRFKQDDSVRRSPPPHQSLPGRNDSRRPRPSLSQSNTSLPPSAQIPAGPGGPALPAGGRYDRERGLDGDRDRERPGYDRPPHGDRPGPGNGRRNDRPRGPPQQGVNSAPIANNRWGNNSAGVAPVEAVLAPVNRKINSEQEVEIASEPVFTTSATGEIIPASTSTSAPSLAPIGHAPALSASAPALATKTTEAKRARLREEARRAKLLLDRIALEEANLEAEERRAEEERRKREQEAQEMRRIEEERKRKEQEQERKLREEELRLRQERELEGGRRRLEFERDMRERERGAPLPLRGPRDARPDFRGDRPDRAFLPPQESLFARDPLPPQGALLKDGRDREGRREGWDRRRADDGFGLGPGPPGDYPPPPLAERERLPMRDRLGGGPRDRIPFDRQPPGAFGRRPLSPPPAHFDRRRSPPPGNYGPPGPMRGPPLDHPMPPSMRGDLRDRDVRDLRDRDFRGRDIRERDVRGIREPLYPPGPPGRAPEPRGEPGFAGPPPKDLLRRLGKRMDHQLAEPMGGGINREERSDVQRRPSQNNAQTPYSRPLAERMSAVSSPSTPPLPSTAPATDPTMPAGFGEIGSAGNAVPEHQGREQSGGQGQGQGQGQERRRGGGKRKRGGQGGRRDNRGGGGGRHNGNGQGGQGGGGGGGGGEAPEERRGEDAVDPEGR
ncbi:hypothetical protein IAR50_005654 [Cryptococcus sp. DSM 104548]